MLVQNPQYSTEIPDHIFQCVINTVKPVFREHINFPKCPCMMGVPSSQVPLAGNTRTLFREKVSHGHNGVLSLEHPFNTGFTVQVELLKNQ